MKLIFFVEKLQLLWKLKLHSKQQQELAISQQIKYRERLCLIKRSINCFRERVIVLN